MKETRYDRPASILNEMSKIHEKCIHSSLSSFAERILWNFISAYKKFYSSHHVFVRLIKNWKKDPVTIKILSVLSL